MFLPILVALLFRRDRHVVSGFHNSFHFARQGASPGVTSIMMTSYLENLSSRPTGTRSSDIAVPADANRIVPNANAFSEIRKIKQTLTKIETIMKKNPKENAVGAEIGTITPVVSRRYGISGANGVKQPSNSDSATGSYLDHLSSKPASSSPVASRSYGVDSATMKELANLGSTMGPYLDILSSKSTSSSPVVSRSYGVSSTTSAVKQPANLGSPMGSYLDKISSPVVSRSYGVSSATSAVKQPRNLGSPMGSYLENLSSRPTSFIPVDSSISRSSAGVAQQPASPSRLTSTSPVNVAARKTDTNLPTEAAEVLQKKDMRLSQGLPIAILAASISLGIGIGVQSNEWSSILSDIRSGAKFESLMNSFPKDLPERFETYSNKYTKGLATKRVPGDSKDLATIGITVESSKVATTEATAESKDVASPEVTVESMVVASPEVVAEGKYLTPSEVTVESKDLSPPEVTADAKDTETSEVTVESKDSTTAKVAVESADMDTKAATEESKDLAPTGVTVESKDLIVSDAVESIAARPTIELLSKDDDVIPSSNSFPAGEDATKAIDRLTSTKYLNFDKINTGFTVTPKAGASVISSISITTANDSPERDPATWQILGSNNGVDFTEIAQGSMKANPARFHTETMPFSNTKSYTSYKVIFPTIVDASLANSMQVAEVALYGTTV